MIFTRRGFVPFLRRKGTEKNLKQKITCLREVAGRLFLCLRGQGGYAKALWLAALRCKGYGVVMAGLRAGHARPLQTAVNGSRTRGAREGGSPAPFPLTGCRGRLRAAYMPPLQSSRYRHRGFGGAWRRTTSAASQQSWPARAVVCPAEANIARSPVSLRSSVAPRSQPRNSRLKSGGRADGVKNGQ